MSALETVLSRNATLRKFAILRCAHLRMRTPGVLSLTPHFSGVLTTGESAITVSTVSPTPNKPLKRFTSRTVHLAPH
jgi:hypothetical protein